MFRALLENNCVGLRVYEKSQTVDMNLPHAACVRSCNATELAF